MLNGYGGKGLIGKGYWGKRRFNEKVRGNLNVLTHLAG
jgi:hypothetical protein